MRSELMLLAWREHNLGALQLSPGAEYWLDAAVRRATASATYMRYYEFFDHGCDLYDLGMLVTWLYNEPADPAFLEARRWISARPRYLSEHEMQMRMLLAKGTCPLCGTAIASAPGSAGDVQEVIYSCAHFRLREAVDMEAALRDPLSWEGCRWPAADGRLIADSSGEPIAEERTCTVCPRLECSD